MPRPRKEGKALNIKLDLELFNLLEDYCEKTRLTKTAAIEKALEKLLKEKTK